MSEIKINLLNRLNKRIQDRVDGIGIKKAELVKNNVLKNLIKKINLNR
jgi:hypothetical protein